jgi:hypothetical protein
MATTNKYQSLFSSWGAKISLIIIMVAVLGNGVTNIIWSNSNRVTFDLISFSALAILYLLMLNRSIIEIGLDQSDICLRPWFTFIRFPKESHIYANRIFSIGGIGLIVIVIKARGNKRDIYLLWWSPWSEKQNKSAEHILSIFRSSSVAMDDINPGEKRGGV